MANLEIYQLLHPELLSEEILREVLENRCIVVPIVKALSKSEMIEIFNRVALPLPQRQYEETTYLGRKITNLRKKKGIAVAAYEANSALEAATTGCLNTEAPNGCNGSIRSPSIGDRLKPPIEGTKPESKRIRLSSSSDKVEAAVHKDIKRKNEGTNEMPSSKDLKKRQKITWP